MKNGSSSDNQPVASKYSYYVFTLLTLLYMFDYIDRMIVASLFPFIKRDWGLTDAECGMLISAVYWSILAFSFPVSLFIDRWSRKKCIAIMALLWSLATAACAITKNFHQLFMARAAIGIGEAGYAPGGTAMISALFPKSKRALFLGLWSAAIPLGSAIGIAIGGWVANHFGWQHAFGLVAFPGMIVAFLFFWTKDYESIELVKTVKNDTEDSQQVKMSRKDMVREFTHTGSLLATYFAFAGNTFVTTALLSWMPTYFHRIQGLDETTAGLKSSAVMLFAIIGAPLGGYLADRWQKRHANARLHFCIISSSVTAILMMMAFGCLEGYAQYALLLAGGVSVAAFVPAAAAVTQDVVHPGLRATSYSLCVIVQNLVGSSMGPIFVGVVSDRYGISTAMTILPLFSLVASLLFFVASLFYKQDLAKVEKVEFRFES